ncbi:MAG: hypothetical protein LLG93_08045, partial [Deltaproteobacteria bacterium]|nr:hypothetical protein [Deltaproteobacteria bacterium]
WTRKAMAVATGVSLIVTLGAGTVLAATLQETEAVWGSPVAVQKLDNGIEKRYYGTDNTMDLGFRVFSYKDGTVVAEGFERVAPVAEKAAKAGLPDGVLSGSFQSAGAQDLDKIWGKPAAVRTLENGTEERYYKIENTQDLDYRVFQVKGGQVVASGIAALPTIPEKQAELKGIPVGFLADANGATVSEVESVWGKALSVKKLANGTEERYYKNDNTMGIGDRIFLFKDGKAVATGNF